MYCPKCSQEQVSDEMRFCSRCGFPLGGVKDLIASDGAVDAGQLSCGQRTVRKGAWTMLLSLALTLVVGFLAAIDDDFAVLLLLPLLSFIIGFLLMLYGVFLADRRRARVKGVAPQSDVIPMLPAPSGTAARRPELSPPRFAPIENITAQRVETAEMAGPPSVTENTTRLLDEESNSPRR